MLDVVIVGAGIEGLMAALLIKLREPEFSVHILCRHDDPRRMPPSGDVPRYDGATFGGMANRFVSHFEGHNYTLSSKSYPDMASAFRHTVSMGGWLGKAPDEATSSERRWLARRALAVSEHFGEWSARLFEFYGQYNRIALALWEDLRDYAPHLFDGADCTPGITRIYTDAEQFEAAHLLHQRYEALSNTQESFSFEDRERRARFLAENPGLRSGIESGFLRGGVLQMDERVCFSLNIHAYCRNLIEALENEGAVFHFGHEVTDIGTIGANRIAHLEARPSVRQGEGLPVSFAARHYVLAPGAYGSDLLNQTPARGDINGVAGGWVTVHGAKPCAANIKFHGPPYHVEPDGEIRFGSEEGGSPRPVIDQNHQRYGTGTQGSTVIGGGYVWLGEGGPEHCAASLDIMREENLRIARKIYGGARGAEVAPRDELCIRSFTYNDLPLMRLSRDRAGNCSAILGGFNTGTTTAASLTARLVSDFIVGAGGTASLSAAFEAMQRDWTTTFYRTETQEFYRVLRRDFGV